MIYFVSIALSLNSMSIVSSVAIMKKYWTKKQGNSTFGFLTIRILSGIKIHS